MKASERLAALALIAAHAEYRGKVHARDMMASHDPDDEYPDPPYPLSGEHGGESIPEVFHDAGVDVNTLDDDTYQTACDLYEETYEAAWYLTIGRE